MTFQIDNKTIQLEAGKTILHHATKAGIPIPTMCFGSNDFQNHPSCMVCVVMEKQTGRLLPSCAALAAEGMEIETQNDEIQQARREALELLMSEHVGDCEAPCRNGCPAFMNIPLMNRLIAAGKHAEAHRVVRHEIALPLILGYICPAPCEKVCRRAQADQPISICQLKKFVAAEFYQQNDFSTKYPSNGKSVAIIGAGPAGLACAFHLNQMGYRVVVFDQNETPGGNLLKIPADKLPVEILQKELQYLLSEGIEFRLNQKIKPDDCIDFLKNDFRAVVLATGKPEDENIQNLKTPKDRFLVNPETFMTSHSGIFSCGSIIKEQNMAVKSLAQGKATAKSVNSFITEGQPLPVKRKFNSKFGKLKVEEIAEYLKESAEGKRISSDAGELNGYDNEEAKAEAERCLHCDCRKAEGCKLRDLADDYNIDRRKYSDGKRKSIRKFTTHPAIVFEPNKCIRCGLCIEIARADKSLAGLTFLGRGFDVRVDIPFDEEIENALKTTALQCAQMCPTAAISKK
jgi:NADPH-dependent glutamate synthase beta subunit-like oxidoreductase/ferredoxin